MQSATYVRVWDPLVRFFHWALVLSFTVAYLSEDLINLHSYVGYTLLGLLLVRIVWGIIGPGYARFANFVYKPSTIKAYLKDLLIRKPKRYIGHNPAGGLMIIMMLLSLLFVSVSGIIVLGMEEEAGPFSSYVAQLVPISEDSAEAVHEFYANFSLFLVGIHVIGVLTGSFLHRENLVKAMITGLKRA